MKELTIDPELRDCLPPLTDDERQALKESIQEEGRAMVPILTWANHDETIIDGMHRYEFCTELGLPFETKALKFDAKSDVISWMIKHQAGRRNLTPTQKRELLGKLYKEKKKESKGRPQNGKSNDVSPLVSTEKNGITGDTNTPPERARDAVAKDQDVSPATVARAAALAEDLTKIPAPAKAAITSDKVAHSDKDVHALAELPKAKREKAAELIAAGEVKSVKEAVAKVSPKPAKAPQNPELKELTALLNLIGKAAKMACDINSDLYPSKHYEDVHKSLDAANKAATLWKQRAKK